MLIKNFEENDYNLLCSWWFEQGWSPVSLELLPKIGFIVNDICAGFLYINDSKICHLEWIIADPRSSKEERSTALDTLIDMLVLTAKEYGCNTVFTATKHENLIKRFKKNGFIVTDTNVSHLIKRI
jgi:N-acetylglutamate synthase-like GNAT family acetyltransferase